MAMTVLRRLALALPTLVGVIVVVFVILRLVPGDPIAMMVSSEASAEEVASLRAAYGLDKPIYIQFAIYLGDLVRGDFGTSITFKQDVLELVLQKLPATLELAFVAIVISIVLGVALGLSAAFWRDRWPEALVDGLNSVFLAIPEFLWGLLLILMFAVFLPYLPISGRLDPSRAFEFVTKFYLFESLLTGKIGATIHLLTYLALPAVALALPMLAVIARVLKTSLLEVLIQDYIVLARIKGFRAIWILFRHALPNALVPTVTLTGIHLIFLVGGTVLVELVFAYPGMGNMLFTAVINRDLPLIQGVTLVFAALFVVLNSLIDLLYMVLDPRVSHG
jgi:dipeptide transport system permease protein